MKKHVILISFAILCLFPVFSQVAINTTGDMPDNSAMLDVQSAERGVLIPRMTAAQRDAIVSPATGLLVYVTGDNKFYYYNGVEWRSLSIVEKINDLLDGKSDNDGSEDYSSVFLGYGSGANDDQSDNANTAVGYQSLYSNENGFNNVAVGYLSMYSNNTGANNISIGRETLYSNTSGFANVAIGTAAMKENTIGYDNIAIGYEALRKGGYMNIAIGHGALRESSTGEHNTALGHNSLFSNTSGKMNNAFGKDALYHNTTGNNNNAIGIGSMFYNTTGDNNTAVGYNALAGNVSGYSNVAVGTKALLYNTDRSNLVAIGDSALYHNGLNASQSYHAIYNTAIGSKALYSNTTGANNTANGFQSLYSNTTGTANTANGMYSLRSNTTGVANTANGISSLYFNTMGYDNTANGTYSLYSNTTGARNTATGYFSLYSNTTGNNNTALGCWTFYNGQSYENSTALGYYANITASNQVRIGNGSVTSIGGYAAWSNLSDGRFKTGVKENVPGMALVMKLRPVTYHLDMEKLAKWQKTPDSLRLRKAEQQKAAEVQIGFIAQEVEQAAQSLNFDFHAVDKPKNPEDRYGLRYAEFVPVLVKALQEVKRENDNLKARLNQYEEKNRILYEKLSALEDQMDKIIRKTPR